MSGKDDSGIADTSLNGFTEEKVLNRVKKYLENSCDKSLVENVVSTFS